MARRIYTNNLTAGEVSKAVSLHPESPQYQNGCEQIDGFEMDIGGLVPAKGLGDLNGAKPYTYTPQGYADIGNGGGRAYYWMNVPFKESKKALSQAYLDIMNEKKLDFTIDPTAATPVVDLISEFSKISSSAQQRMIAVGSDEGATKGKFLKDSYVYISKTVTFVDAIYLNTACDAYDPTVALGGLIVAEGTAPSVGPGWVLQSKWNGSFDVKSVFANTGGFFPMTSASTLSTDLYGFSLGEVSSDTYVNDPFVEFYIFNGHVKVKMGVGIVYTTITPGLYKLANDFWFVAPIANFTTGSRFQLSCTLGDHGGSADKLGVAPQVNDCFAICRSAGQASSVSFVAPTVTQDTYFITQENVPAGTAGLRAFGFTDRTEISVDRRIGPAVFNGNTNIFGFTAAGQMGGVIGDTTTSTKLAGTLLTGLTVPALAVDAADTTANLNLNNSGQYGPSGTVIPSSILATSPYYVTLDSTPKWFEQTYSGVMVGTSRSEYLIQGIQSTETVSIQKVSNIGSPGTPSAKYGIKASCIMAGKVYFASSLGISSLQFSTERNNYIPQHISFYGTRLEGFVVTSMAENVDDASFYFVAKSLKTNESVLRKVSSDTGAVMNPGISFEGFNLHAVVSSDGVCSVVLIDSSLVMESIPISTAKVQTGYLRTTRFGVGPGNKSHLHRLFFTGSNIRKLSYRIEGEEDYKPVDLLESEYINGFTGVKEVMVDMVMPEPSNGVAVEIKLDSSPDVDNPTPLRPELISVSVEMEV